MLAFLLALTALLTFGCGKEPSVQPNVPQGLSRAPETTGNKEHLLVYYAAQKGDYLVPINVTVTPNQDVIRVAVEKLLAGPGNDFADRVLPEETKLRDAYLSQGGDQAVVDLTGEFAQLPDAEMVKKALDAMALTLAENTSVKSVQVLVTGAPLEDFHGFDLTQPWPVGQVNPVTRDGAQYPVQVYYSDSNAMFLVPLTFDAGLESAKEQMEYAINKLLEGPEEDSGLMAVINPKTKLLSLSWDAAAGLVTLNLSSDALEYGGGSTAELMLVNSLSYTVQQFSGVRYLKLLFDGEEVNLLPEGTDLTKPLELPRLINPAPQF